MSASHIYTMIIDWDKAQALIRDGKCPSFSLWNNDVVDAWTERAKCEIKSPKIENVLLYKNHSSTAVGRDNYKGLLEDLIKSCTQYLFFYLDKKTINSFIRIFEVLGINTLQWQSTELTYNNGIHSPKVVNEVCTIFDELNLERVKELLTLFPWFTYYDGGFDELEWDRNIGLRDIYGKYSRSSKKLFDEIYYYSDEWLDVESYFSIKSTNDFIDYLAYYQLLFSEAKRYNAGVYIELF